ncbi:hypothetical protein SteCoe_29929 [Stentor coeruleus]|uniref:Uncharacterized protein n=1 Tax=Stentor coeruleus TaxID=5963 RepID=A0A1R2B4P4_9CILI|nr:hypothetical protein SteCoe_29929 [Stentor coeruleus]
MAVVGERSAFVRVSQNSHDFQGEIKLSRNQSNLDRYGRQKIFEVLKFHSFFVVFEEVFLDLARLKSRFEADYERSCVYLGEVFTTIDKKIDEEENKINSARKNLNNLIKSNEGNNLRQITQEYLTNQARNLTLTIGESNKRRQIDSARTQDMDMAREYTKYESELKYYPENLENMREQKMFVMGDLKRKIDLNSEEFQKRWTELNNYYQEIIRSGNPLENNFQLDRDILTKYSKDIIPCLEQLKFTSLLLFNLREEVLLRDKIIVINIEIANKKIQIAGQEVAMPYLEALLEKANQKVDEITAQQLTFTNNDKISHLTNCIVDINTNLNNITTDLSNLSGHANLNTGSVTVYANIRPLTYRDPTVFAMGPEARKLYDDLIECVKDRDKIQSDFNLLALYKKELKELENRKSGFHIERVNSENNLSQIFDTIANSYVKIFASRVDLIEGDFTKQFIFDASMLNCLLSVLSKFISISKNPGCCSCGSATESLAIDITANQLIKVFVKILGVAMKVKTGCCSGNDLNKIYSCTNIDLDDVVNLLFSNRVFGSLLDDNGQKQKIINNARTAQVNKSLFYCLREVMSLRAIQHSYLYDINKEHISFKIKTYEDSFIKMLQHLNYMRISSKAEHHKLIKN